MAERTMTRTEGAGELLKRYFVRHLQIEWTREGRDIRVAPQGAPSGSDRTEMPPLSGPDKYAVIGDLMGSRQFAYAREVDIPYVGWQNNQADRAVAVAPVAQWLESNALEVYSAPQVDQVVQENVESALERLPEGLVDACVQELDRRLDSKRTEMFIAIEQKQNAAIAAIELAKEQAIVAIRGQGGE